MLNDSFDDSDEVTCGRLEERAEREASEAERDRLDDLDEARFEALLVEGEREAARLALRDEMNHDERFC